MDGEPLDDTADHNGPPNGADEAAPEPQGIRKDDTPNPNPSAKDNDGKQNDPIDSAMVRWTRAVGIFTGVLAVVGAVQSWAFIQSERAALYVVFDRISPLPITDQPLFFDMSIINTGRAQAYFSEIRVKLFGGQALPKKPNFADAEFTASGVVPAGHTRYLHLGPTDNNMHWGQIDDVNRGAAKFWMYGFLKFTDDYSLFGSKIVGFCGRYEPTAIGKSPAPGAPISDCDDPSYTYTR